MGQGKGQASAHLGTRDPEQIKEEIEEARQDLGDTVAAVAQKADVKSRAKAKVASVKATARAKAPLAAQPESEATATNPLPSVNPLPTASIAAFGGGIVIGWILGRR